MLKSTAHSIVSSVTTLFNMSIASGTVPSGWKTSAVVPIPKGSDSTNVSNYRPISLLSILSKLLERHIHGLMYKHLLLYHPIAIQQWGFQPCKSTVSALVDVTHQWSRHLDNGAEVCVVFFDLKKAFDSVPHRTLINKLSDIGFPPHLIQPPTPHTVDCELSYRQIPACSFEWIFLLIPTSCLRCSTRVSSGAPPVSNLY